MELPEVREHNNIATDTEDAWDCVVINNNKKTINLVRFFVEEDRFLKY